jgi:CopG family transcriptional regulator, nickel-responsive regulator
MRHTSELKRFGVSMEDELLKPFDRLCAEKGYATRSEAIRDMVRAQPMEEKLEQGDTEAVGTLTVAYDHHQRELQEKLTDYQHHFLHAIVATLHVHLDAHRCLEVVVLRGKANKIKKIADGLIAAKGVKHGKLVITTPATM